MADNEFAEMLAAMDRWIATQERDGWASPEVEERARRVRCGLWACANNTEPHKVLTEILGEDIEALAKARSQKPDALQNLGLTMPITRDIDFPAKIAQLMQAFNKCADGHDMRDVIDAAGNMLSAAIHNYAAVAGMPYEAFESFARAACDGVLRSAKLNWQRASKTTDIVVTHQ